MADVTVEDRENNMKKIDELDGLAKGVKVGVLSDSGRTQQIKASVHEFGATIPVTDAMRGWFLAQGFPLSPETDKIIIPERRFIRPVLDRNESFVTERFRGLILEAIQGRIDADDILPRIGNTLVTLMQQQMGENGPGLSGMTLAMRRGGGNATPLVDTGRLKNSIQWEEI